MDNKEKLNSVFSSASQKAKSLLGNAVQYVDQNNDGKFDLSDVSVIAGTMTNAVQKGTQAVMDNMEEKARLLELKTLRPIFPHATDNAISLDDSDFYMPKFIHVCARDKKYASSEVCKGSIGYISEEKGLRIVNIFRDSIDAFGLSFYPDSDCEFYYVDPSDRDNYIALDEYFGYLKTVRVNELKRIAQDLGAKYFKVTYKEEQTSFTSTKSKAGLKLSGNNKVEASTDHSEKKFSRAEIEAEMRFPGHTPIKPQLKYLQRDTSIQTLVSMRLDEKAPLMSEKFMLNMSHSSGMKESDAVKIDAVLKGLKLSGNASVASEAQSESRKYLEYDIEF